MLKDKKIYRIIVINSMIILAAVIINLFFRIYYVSKDNIIYGDSTKASQQTKDLEYILQREVTELTLTAGMIENMIAEGKSNSDILNYLKNESETTVAVIDGNDTGVYGYIRGEYLDGVGWVPDADYNPLTRPWYKDAIKANGDFVLVEPYLDAQTKTYMMSVAKMLNDNVSVVSFDIYLSGMQEQVNEITSEDGKHIIVLTDAGLIVASSLSNEIGKYLSDKTNNYLTAMSNSLKKSDNDDFEFTYGGKSYIVFNKIMYGNWRTLVIQESKGMFSSLNYLYISAITLIIIILINTGILIHIINKRRKKAEDVSKQLQSVADIYISMYKIDLIKDIYEEKKGDSYIGNLVHDSSPKATVMLHDVIRQLTKGLEQEVALEFSDLSIQLERLDVNDTVTCEFETINGWVRARYIVIERKKEQIGSILWLLENIDKEKKREKELVEESVRDELTGLYNRKAYEDNLRNHPKIPPEDNFVYVALDVNGLKAVNDNLGHTAGDELLKGATKCIKQCFESYGRIYRTGGDEFVAIIFVDEKQLNKIKKDFREVTDSWTGETVKELSVSCGYATKREFPSAKVVEIAEIADERMYENKKDYYLTKGVNRKGQLLY